MLKDFLEGKPLQHPIHPMLVHFPIGLFLLSFLLDLASLASSSVPNLVRGSFYAIAFGLAASLLAVPTGLVDWSGIKKEKPAWKIGLYHLALNVVVTALFAINLGLRLHDFRDASIVATAPLTLSIWGTAILIVSAYVGGRMTYHYGISVARMSKDEWREIAAAGGANLPPE